MHNRSKLSHKPRFDDRLDFTPTLLDLTCSQVQCVCSWLTELSVLRVLLVPNVRLYTAAESHTAAAVSHTAAPTRRKS